MLDDVQALAVRVELGNRFAKFMRAALCRLAIGGAGELPQLRTLVPPETHQGLLVTVDQQIVFEIEAFPECRLAQRNIFQEIVCSNMLGETAAFSRHALPGLVCRPGFCRLLEYVIRQQFDLALGQHATQRAEAIDMLQSKKDADFFLQSGDVPGIPHRLRIIECRCAIFTEIDDIFQKRELVRNQPFRRAFFTIKVETL